MTAQAAPGELASLKKAAEVVDLGLRACEAYGRGDLATRLKAVRQRLTDPAVHIVVAGEFKQGKSSLVNALVGANVCPVDDDVATAVPTYVRNGAQPQAYVLIEPAPDRGPGLSAPGLSAPGLTSPSPNRVDEAAIRRVPVEPTQVRRYVVESAPADAAAEPPLTRPGERVAGVEIWLPRQLLAGGLVLVDTPGVGGLGSAHAAASLAAIAAADAVIFVTD